MRVLSNLRELEESLADWKRYQRYSLQDIKKDRDKSNMVLHAMLISVQSAIDIAYPLISLNALRRPGTYREAFDLIFPVLSGADDGSRSAMCLFALHRMAEETDKDYSEIAMQNPLGKVF